MTEDEATELESLLATIGDARGSLRPGERAFVDDVEARYDAEGAGMFLTARQWSWLRSIGDRL